MSPSGCFLRPPGLTGSRRRPPGLGRQCPTRRLGCGPADGRPHARSALLSAPLCPRSPLRDLLARQPRAPTPSSASHQAARPGGPAQGLSLQTAGTGGREGAAKGQSAPRGGRATRQPTRVARAHPTHGQPEAGPPRGSPTSQAHADVPPTGFCPERGGQARPVATGCTSGRPPLPTPGPGPDPGRCPGRRSPWPRRPWPPPRPSASARGPGPRSSALSARPRARHSPRGCGPNATSTK